MSEISKQALKVDNNTSFPNNNTGYISPSILRAFNVNMIDSLVDEITFTNFSGSVTSSIQQLSAFTASQQPSFTALNQFTASQLVINSGYNATTQSLSASIAGVVAEVDQLQTWSGSVNQIIASNVSLGYATRFNFSGFITASLVSNVNGTIADISVTADSTKVNTSSFNDYTASTNVQINSLSSSQAIWNASATASIGQLLSFSSSLSGGFATQGELDASASALQNNIDTKLSTSSFNAYTQSQNNLNVTFATTGSNTFIGNQSITGNNIITGSLFVSSSNTSDVVIQGQVFISSSTSGSTNNAKLTISGSTAGTINGRNAQVVIQPQSIVLTRGVSNVNINVGNISVANSGSTANMLAQSLGSTGSVGVVSYELTGSTDNELWLQADLLGSYISDWDSVATNYRKNIFFPPNPGTNPSPRFLRGLETSGSVIITGSALGNINPLTIASNTASMDLSKANFFTLSLVSGSTTHLTATNIKQGQTINLLISQPSVGTGSVTYNSTFKFPNGSSYTQTNLSDAKDILTFITFDNSTIYATPVNNLV